MPDYPGTVSHKEVEKVAKILGFVLRSQSGSHRQNKKEGVRVFPIPTYKNITVNSHLFSSMLRSMDITKKEFFEILES